MKKKINGISSLVSVSRNLNAIYNVGQTKGRSKVVGLALVVYADGSQGFELVGIDSKGDVGCITQDVIEVVGAEQVIEFRDNEHKRTYGDDNYFLNKGIK